MNDCDLTKVLIQSDKNTVFAVRPGKDFFIARIFRPITRPDNIMPTEVKILNGTSPITHVSRRTFTFLSP